MMLSSENDDDQGRLLWYTCPRCGKRSYSPQDVAQRYCGYCHTFEDQNALTEALERGSEPFWMQDVRLAQRRIQAARQHARRARLTGEG